MVCQKKLKKGTIKGYGSAASFKHGVILIETKGGNSHFDVNLTDFNAKRIKSKNRQI